jgi:hypothetical protein
MFAELPLGGICVADFVETLHLHFIFYQDFSLERCVCSFASRQLFVGVESAVFFHQDIIRGRCMCSIAVTTLCMLYCH